MIFDIIQAKHDVNMNERAASNIEDSNSAKQEDDDLNFTDDVTKQRVSSKCGHYSVKVYK